MKIERYLQDLQRKPDALRIIGLGSRAVAIVHSKNSWEVLLLQTSEEIVADKSSGNENSPALSPRHGSPRGSSPGDRAFERTLAFAEKYDQIIADNLPPRFTHSSVLGGKILERPICVKINANLAWKIVSARLTKRIYGTPLDYRDFVGPAPKVDALKTKTLAKDLAEWVYALHYRVGPAAEAAHKDDFQRAAETETKRFSCSGRYKTCISRNAKKIDELRSAVEKDPSLAKLDPKQAQAVSGISAVGTDIGTIGDLASLLKKRIDEKLSADNEIGLVHGDLHPGNIIVTNSYWHVSGVCDWMNVSFDNRVVDFLGLSMAKGLLPAVLKEYGRLEKAHESTKRIDKELVHAYASMYVLFQFMAVAKDKDEDISSAHLRWRQVVEQVECLAKINPDVYGDIKARMTSRPAPEMPEISRVRPYASIPGFCGSK
ncbi:MAG: phosphotransferase [Bdellovibrionales bacterium]